MSESMWAVADRKALPSINELVDAVTTSEFELALDSDWSWEGQSGWLPIIWRGNESGCEVELSELRKKDAAAISNAGLQGMDCLIEITPRGWDAYQSCVVFGAILATIGKAVITEDMVKFIASSEAIRWAKDSVHHADKYQKIEEEAFKAKNAAITEGQLDQQLIKKLNTFNGQTAQIVKNMDRIVVAIPSGEWISGANWRLHAGNRCFQCTHYSMVSAEQLSVLNQLSVAEEKGETGDQIKLLWKRFETLKNKLENARVLDKEDKQAAAVEIESWPDKITIMEMSWVPPHTVKVEFSNEGERWLEFIGGGNPSSVQLIIPPLNFDIGNEIRLV